MKDIIDLNKMYRTRNGQKVEDLERENGGRTNLVIRGRIKGRKYKDSWTEKGKFLGENMESGWDLVERKEGE